MNDRLAEKGGGGQAEEAEEQEVHEKQMASAYVVYRAISEEADEEMGRSVSELAWSGLAAGLSICFSMVSEAVLKAHLPEAHWTPLVSRLGYSVGFLIVVLGRQQLFTENTLTPVLSLLRDRHGETLWKLLRLWAIVFVMNMVGTALFAIFVAKTGVLEEASKVALTDLARETIKPDFWTTVVRGIFAGWLIALMVWLLPVAETGRVGVIVIMTYLIGLGSFSHVVAGSGEVFYLAASGEASWGKALGLFVAPALIGNVIGGVGLVAALNYAQAAKKE